MVVDKSKISILLATYNGSRFLTEQLDSLLNQSYNNFDIIIRDDGSTDSTLEIIQDYITRYPEKIRLLNDDVKHRGPCNSFLYLLENVDSDYYMFCDQDDVWLPNKVEISLSRIKEVEDHYPQTPVMIHTDLILVDSNLNLMFKSFWKWSRFNVDLNKHLCFVPFGNVFTGCTMIFNKFLKRYVFPVPDFVEMHDQWIGLMAVKYGKVENIKQGTIKYRQHGGNVCSSGGKKNFSLNKITNKKGWYKEKELVLNRINYGSKAKAYFCKFIYSGIRLFFHN